MLLATGPPEVGAEPFTVSTNSLELLGVQGGNAGPIVEVDASEESRDHYDNVISMSTLERGGSTEAMAMIQSDISPNRLTASGRVESRAVGGLLPGDGSSADSQASTGGLFSIDAPHVYEFDFEFTALGNAVFFAALNTNVFGRPSRRGILRPGTYFFGAGMTAQAFADSGTSASSFGTFDFSFSLEPAAPVPEPATFGMVLAGLALAARRFRGRHSQ